MANRSITSSTALHNQKLVVTETERRTWDWEVVEDEDLYADVESLESFSISSADEDDQPQGIRDGPDEAHDEFGSSNLAIQILGQDLEVALPQIHSRLDSVHSCENDVVGEPIDRGVFPSLVGPPRFVVPYRDQGFLNLSVGEEDEDSKAVEIQEDDDVSEYESDVDDELVPRGFSDRLDKQRMRKLGKRTCTRMNKSKKMAHLQTKAACLHGKHGLGLKAY